MSILVLLSAAQLAEPLLSIDTPVLKLLDDPHTKPVIEKHLPPFVKALTEDEQAVELFGRSSLRELAVDPHVLGITAELLKALQADLLAAQSPN